MATPGLLSLTPPTAFGELRGDLERLVFLLGGSDGEQPFDP